MDPNTAEPIFLDLPAMADRLGVRPMWLRREALADRVPCLRAATDLLFDAVVVEAALKARVGAAIGVASEPTRLVSVGQLAANSIMSAAQIRGLIERGGLRGFLFGHRYLVEPDYGLEVVAAAWLAAHTPKRGRARSQGGANA